MIAIDRRPSVLRRLAWWCAAMVLVVTSASALLRQSKAGLGCADWPACYGEALRRAQQGLAPSAETQTTLAAVRLAHRVTATAALLLVVTMLMVCFGSRPLLVREGRLAAALLALALGLAVLGLFSANARVPAVAMGNLLGGFVMLALCVRLARPHDPLPGAGAHAWAIAATLLLVLQVGLGGLASASYAGLSCSGLGGCPFAEVVRTADWASLNPWREPVLHPVPPINPGGALVHTLHRATALGLALLLAPIGVIALRRGRRRAGAAILLLLAAQWSIGLAMSVLALPLGLALLHNMLAALLLATLLTLV